ncbi:hypothetical protein [Neobacillus sp.]|uniref:hypothetical protein n=1 Tax=Neobacillus sp. TaxID=2675273 RepID=UPI0028A0D3FB|nr:hypothetical protein [Neobacillus sp.]
MIYNARTQRGVLGFFLAITVASITMIKIYNRLLYFQILLALFILLLIFIQFKFVIDDGYLTYQMLFFAMPIYKKVLFPNQIIQMKFKRIGWTTKGAIIQVKRGLNIRVVNFAPNNVFIDLIDFANENGISISKTKDYLILEK